MAGAASCVGITIGLVAKLASTPGTAALWVAAFVLLAGWCLLHRRVDQSLLVLGLYLGLLDGYLKLRTGSASITLARDVLVGAVAAGALIRMKPTAPRLSLPPLGGLVIAFGAIVLVELLNPNARALGGGLAGVRQHLEFVPLFFLGYAFVRKKPQLERLLLLLVLCASLGGVVSLIQSGLTPEQFAGWGPGYSERVLGTGEFLGAGRRTSDAFGKATVRPFGLGSDAGAGAVFGALALPAVIALLLTSRGRRRLSVGVLSVGVAVAIATSGSRGALILAFVSLVWFGVVAAASKNALRAIVGLSVMTILVYFAFTQLAGNNAATQRSRTIVSSSAVSTYRTERGQSLANFDDYVRKYPLGVGVGHGGPAASYGGSDPLPARQKLDYEAGWNFFVLEVGLFGLVVYVLLNLRLCALAIRRIRRMPDNATRLYLAALAGPIMGLFLQNFSGASSVSVPGAPYLWLVAGVLSYWLVTSMRPTPSDETYASPEDRRPSGTPLTGSPSSA
jgi:hypothetical protein